MDQKPRNVVLTLIAMGLGVIILAQDFSAINVALPAIERAFDTDVSTAQWVINAYALVFGMFIVAGGRLADQFGRRRIFFVGTIIFAVFSLVGALSPSIAVLIGSRAIMGIGGAMMWPAILGMTYDALPKEKAGLAGGIIIGAAGIGQGIGPITGGALTMIDWRLVFLLNIPICLFAMAVTFFEVPESATSGAQKIDFAGIATMSLGLLALLLALDQLNEWGITDPRLIGLVVLAIVLFILFVVIERRAGPNALIPSDVIRNREFLAACLATFFVVPSFVGPLLYVPQYFQKLLQFSPLDAGLALLPMMVAFAGLSFIAGRLYDRVGPKLMVTAGALCLAIGPFLMSLAQPSAGVAGMAPGMLVLGVGLGLFYSSVTNAGVGAVDSSRTSLAGGLIYMFQLAGGSIGLGLTTTVVTAVAQSQLAADISRLGGALTPSQITVLQGLLVDSASAQQALAALPPAVASQLVTLVSDAFLAGIRVGLQVNAALAVVGVIISALYIGQKLRVRIWHPAIHRAHG
jgi:EmrB/QacA subfamily drug resistance transporter